VNLREFEMQLGRRFARLATNAVVRRPGLWRAFRGPVRRQFDRLAPRWDAMRSEEAFAPLRQALDAIPAAPSRALDLGTGTGLAAFVLAERYAQAEIVGVDVADRMIEVARRNTPPELSGRVRFEQADAANLPFDDGSFELVTLANMIPFFAELARVTAPGGWAVFTFSSGPDTPIWVPPERLRSELGPLGFSDFADFEVDGGTALLARKDAAG
jgi:SAM-dependent methyltransferase